MPSHTWLELQELVAIVSRAIPQRAQIIARNSKKEVDYVKLFRLIEASPSSPEYDVAKQLGKSSKAPSFIMLRTFLKRILVNTLFVLDIDRTSLSPLTKAYHHSNRDIFVLKTLVAFGARTVARDMASAALEVAKKYELLDNVFFIEGFLREESSRRGDLEAHHIYLDQQIETLEKIALESRVIASFEEIETRFARSGSEKPELGALIAHRLSELKANLPDSPTFSTSLYLFRLEALAHQVALDFAGTYEISTRAQSFVEASEIFCSPGRIAEFAAKRSVCLLQLGDYSVGHTLIQRTLPSILSGTSNWLVLMEQRFLIEMHQLTFDSARSTLAIVESNTLFGKLLSHQKQKWKLYKLYLDFAQNSLTLNRRSVRGFLDAVPAYVADKAGYNIAVLILHTICLIDQQSFLKASDRIEALRAYSRRHLGVRGSERESVFVKLLIQAERCSFDRKLTSIRTEKLIAELRAVSSRAKAAGPQILPYEYLWSRVLDALK